MARKSHKLKIDGGWEGIRERYIGTAGRNGILSWRDCWSDILYLYSCFVFLRTIKEPNGNWKSRANNAVLCKLPLNHICFKQFYSSHTENLK